MIRTRPNQALDVRGTRIAILPNDRLWARSAEALCCPVGIIVERKVHSLRNRESRRIATVAFEFVPEQRHTAFEAFYIATAGPHPTIRVPCGPPNRGLCARPE